MKTALALRQAELVERLDGRYVGREKLADALRLAEAQHAALELRIDGLQVEVDDQRAWRNELLAERREGRKETRQR